MFGDSALSTLHECAGLTPVIAGTLFLISYLYIMIIT